MEDWYPNQKEITDKEECLKAIENANSVRALNMLRASVLSFKSNDILQIWQKKYWSYKQ